MLPQLSGKAAFDADAGKFLKVRIKHIGQGFGRLRQARLQLRDNALFPLQALDLPDAQTGKYSNADNARDDHAPPLERGRATLCAALCLSGYVAHQPVQAPQM